MVDCRSLMDTVTFFVITWLLISAVATYKLLMDSCLSKTGNAGFILIRDVDVSSKGTLLSCLRPSTLPKNYMMY